MKIDDELVSRVADRIRESIAVKQAILEDAALLATVAEVGKAMVNSLRAGGMVFFLGNGGSAADAQHLAAELNGRYQRDRPGLPGMALTTNTSSLTAIANDYSYELVFSRQLQAMGAEGDLVFGISTSGNSPNVLRAMQVAGEMGLLTIALTGQSGGRLANGVQYCLRVPSAITARIQEAHILLGHILCEIVEESLFDARSNPGSRRRRNSQSTGR